MTVEPGIKPIETRYKGYRFRSRLEARWAVFLDKLGVTWEYEPEGYVLGNVSYLPDFWLPEQQEFLEIKGVWPVQGDEAWMKAQVLAEATECWVTMLIGQLADRPYGVVGLRFNPYKHYGPENDQWGSVRPAWWFRCPVCQRWGLAWAMEDLPCCLPLHPDRVAGVQDALDAARGARFEHGEKG